METLKYEKITGIKTAKSLNEEYNRLKDLQRAAKIELAEGNTSMRTTIELRRRIQKALREDMEIAEYIRQKRLAQTLSLIGAKISKEELTRRFTPPTRSLAEERAAIQKMFKKKLSKQNK